MDQLTIIIVAVTVAGLVWGVAMLVQKLSANEKRRIQERLSSESSLGGNVGAVRPLLLPEQATGLPGFLGKHPIAQSMQRWLAAAFPQTPLSRFLLWLSATMFGMAATAALISGNLTMSVLAAAVGAGACYFFVASKRSKRRRLFNSQLPEALDFLSRILRSGQSFSTGLQMMSEELPQPIAGEFRRCYDQHSLGQSIEQGLRDMALRVNSPDFSFFTTAAVIQRQTGGDLAEVLHNISDMVRKRLRLAQAVKAKTAEGRFTGYIMVAFPAIMFVITYFLDPKRGDVMLYTSTGHMLIGIAIGLQVFGLLLIKRITTVKV